MVSLSHSPSLSSWSLCPLQPPHPGVSLSPSPPPACLPPLCKGPENTQRELCQTTSIRRRDQPAQLFSIPSALAGFRHQAGSPTCLHFGGWGEQILASGPPGSQMGGQGSITIVWGHSRRPAGPQDRTKPQRKARVTKTMGEVRARSRAAGAGLEGLRPSKCPMLVFTPRCTPMFSLTHDPCTHSPAHSQSAHTHTYTNQSAQA